MKGGMEIDELQRQSGVYVWIIEAFNIYVDFFNQICIAIL